MSKSDRRTDSGVYLPPDLSEETRHDTFQVQLKAYKDQIELNLDYQLGRADSEIDGGMTVLTQNFHQRCDIIRKIAEKMDETLFSETIEIASGERTETIDLGTYMDDFRKTYISKTTHLEKLWCEYEEVQHKIMEYAIGVLDNDEIEILHLDKEAGHNRKAGEVENNHFHKADLAVQREAFQSGYNCALEDLGRFRNDLKDLTTRSLMSNSDILETFQRDQAQKVTKIRLFFQDLQQE